MKIFGAMTIECYPVPGQTTKISTSGTFQAGTTTVTIYGQLIEWIRADMPPGHDPIVTFFAVYPDVIVPADTEAELEAH